MDFVLVYAQCESVPSHPAVFVVKNRPENQRGRVNLPGGKLEKDEKPLDAAIRELKEETGLDPLDTPEQMGVLQGSWGRAFCFRAPVAFKQLRPVEGETEEFFWSKPEKLVNDKRTLPSLRIVMPLMVAGLKNWKVEAEYPKPDDVIQTFSVTVRA